MRQQAVAIVETGEYESPDDSVCRVDRQGPSDGSNLSQLVETLDQSRYVIGKSEGRVNDDSRLRTCDEIGMRQ